MGCGTITNLIDHGHGNLIRKWWQSGPTEIELHTVQAVTRHGLKGGVECRSHERLGEDPEFHQTGPVTSASRVNSPDSLDRAMATIARTAATPSSSVAPRIGVPSRIASANPSTCNR